MGRRRGTRVSQTGSPHPQPHEAPPPNIGLQATSTTHKVQHLDNIPG